MSSCHKRVYYRVSQRMRIRDGGGGRLPCYTHTTTSSLPCVDVLIPSSLLRQMHRRVAFTKTCSPSVQRGLLPSASPSLLPSVPAGCSGCAHTSNFANKRCQGCKDELPLCVYAKFIEEGESQAGRSRQGSSIRRF